MLNDSSLLKLKMREVISNLGLGRQRKDLAASGNAVLTLNTFEREWGAGALGMGSHATWTYRHDASQLSQCWDIDIEALQRCINRKFKKKKELFWQKKHPRSVIIVSERLIRITSD